MMYFSMDDLTIAELEKLVEQAQEHYHSCVAACVLAEGALTEARSSLCREILSDKRIYPHHVVLMHFKDEPTPVRMRYEGTESGKILLRRYTPKGNLSTVIERYGWKACYNMLRDED